MPLKKHEADKLIDVIRGFVDERGKETTTLDVVSADGARGKVSLPTRQVGAAEVQTMIDQKDARAFTLDEEALYQRFKARIIDDAQIDPLLLRMIAVQPEMIVEYERRTETLDGSSLRGRIAQLIHGGFFDEPRTNGNVVTELRRIGTEPNSGNVSRQLADLIASGFLTRVGNDRYQKAPGVKIRERELETKV